MASILVPLPAGFEEIETVTPIDLLRRAGHDVTIAALGPEPLVVGRSGIALQADTCLADLPAEALFNLLLLPGGPGVKHLRASAEVIGLVQRHLASDRWVAAICAAPLVLHDIGALSGRHYTAHPSTAAELTEIDATSRVVLDGRILTSRGAGTALDFALKAVELLGNHPAADKIAQDICA